MKNKTDNFDEYEISLMKSIENEEWITVQNFEEEKNRFVNIANETFKQMQTIQIKIVKEDFEAIIKKSEQSGITFDKLVHRLLHEYAIGKIHF